jgi:hypothetical protein
LQLSNDRGARHKRDGAIPPPQPTCTAAAHQRLAITPTDESRHRREAAGLSAEMRLAEIEPAC